MQSIDSLGLFWLPDHDGDRLSGRLKFDPAGGGINLSLVGTFDNAADDGGEPAVRIFGWLGSNPVTLESCYSGGSTFGSPGPIRTRFPGIAAAWHSLLSACANN
jgi:hypothetical protein